MSTTDSPQITANGANLTTTIRHDTYPFISPQNSNLSGHAVFITGASKGIGRATALSYAKAGASYIGIGARSSLSSVEADVHAAAKQAGHPAPKVLSVQVDVTNDKDVHDAAERLSEAFEGRLNILVNNAGYLEKWQNIADTDPKEWWKTWEVNIKGTYLVARSFLPLLLKTPGNGNTIINITSAGAHMIRPGASAYQTTKLAVCRFTEFLQIEYRSQGLVCFSMHPGTVQTELMSGLPEDFRAKLELEQPELAADTMVFLSRENREWLGGRYINTTWDMEELLAKREEIETKDLLKVRLAVN